MKALTKEQVFALRAWTVKTKGGKFYAHPTYHSGKEIGPYKSLQAVAAAISRKLAEEYTERNTNLEQANAAQSRKNSRTQRRIPQRREAATRTDNAHKRRA